MASLDRGVFLTFTLSQRGEREFMTRAGLKPATYG